MRQSAVFKVLVGFGGKHKFYLRVLALRGITARSSAAVAQW